MSTFPFASHACLLFRKKIIVLLLLFELRSSSFVKETHGFTTSTCELTHFLVGEGGGDSLLTLSDIII
jgi:hypothetical protein